MATRTSVPTAVSSATPVTEEPTDPGEPTPQALTVGTAAPLDKDVAEIVGRVPLIQGDLSVGVQAVTAQGEVLVVQSEQAEELVLSQGTLRLGPPGSVDRMELIATPPRDEPNQITSADVSARHVVWMETPRIEVNVQPWVLYAYDRRSKTVRQLARSQLVDGRQPPAVPGYTGPVLSGHRVFWAQVSGHVGAERVSVLGCVIDRCVPEVVARGAAFPVATAEDLYVISSPLYRGEKDNRSFKLQRIALADGRTETLRDVTFDQGQEPTGLAADGNHMALTIADKTADVIAIYDLKTSELTVVESDRNGSFGTPCVTPRFIAWAETSGFSSADVGGYLYDLKNQRLFSVGNTAGLYGLDCNGRYVAWRDSTSPAVQPEDIVNVIARLR